MNRTISLIGMPGAGKSTVGVILAKQLGMDFVDTDLEIQVRHGMTLQAILNESGYQALRALEEETLLEIPLTNTLISTGGSAVYSEAGMRRLANAGKVIYIEVALDEILARIHNESERGIARPPDMSLAEVYTERAPLYQAWADLTVPAAEQQTADTTAMWIKEQLKDD